MVGKQARLVVDKQTTNGMLYKNSIVIVQEIICTCKGKDNIRVEDTTGRMYWVRNSDILIV
jgi:hypothetical protein